MSTYTSPLKSTRSITKIGTANREKTESKQSSQPTNSNYTESAAKLRLSNTAQSSLERSSYLSNDPNALSGFEGSQAQELSQLQDSFNANINSSNLAEVHVGAKDKGPQEKPFSIGSAALSALQAAPLAQLAPVKVAETPDSPGKQGLAKALTPELAIASETSAKIEEQPSKSASDLEAVGFSVADEGQTETVNVGIIHSSSDVAAPKAPVSPGRQGLEKAMEQDTTITGDSSAKIEEQPSKSASDLEAVGFSVADEGQTETVNVGIIHSSSDVAAPKAPVSPGRQGLEKAMEQETAIAGESSAKIEEQAAKNASDLEAVGYSVYEEVETEAVNIDVIHSSSDVAAPKAPVSPGRQGLEKALEKEQSIETASQNATLEAQPQSVESNLENVDFTAAQESEAKNLNQDVIGVHAAVEAVKTPESPGQQGLKDALEQPNSIEAKNEVGDKIGKDALDATMEI